MGTTLSSSIKFAKVLPVPATPPTQLRRLGFLRNSLLVASRWGPESNHLHSLSLLLSGISGPMEFLTHTFSSLTQYPTPPLPLPPWCQVSDMIRSGKPIKPVKELLKEKQMEK